jgi:hypothetical protein
LTETSWLKVQLAAHSPRLGDAGGDLLDQLGHSKPSSAASRGGPRRQVVVRAGQAVPDPGARAKFADQPVPSTIIGLVITC